MKWMKNVPRACCLGPEEEVRDGGGETEAGGGESVVGRVNHWASFQDGAAQSDFDLLAAAAITRLLPQR